MARKSRKPNAIEAAKQTGSEEKSSYRTAVYARLSVEDSKNPNCDTIENQLNLIRSYIESKPYLTAAEEYVDNGVSGTHFERPEFLRMIADMRAGKIDCIVVKDLSRLGRNYLEAGDYLDKIFPFFGIRFIAITDGYDSLYPNVTEDGLLIPLKNLINEAYAKDMSKKISTAISLKQQQGKFIGIRAPYGYQKSPKDKNVLIIDPEVSDVVVRIFEYKAKGYGNGRIARILNTEGISAPMRYRYEKGLTKNKRFANSLWNDGTIAVIIVNPVYIGDMEQGYQKEIMHLGIKKYYVDKTKRVYVAGTHEPIISRELFFEVQELVEKRKQQCVESREKYRRLKRNKDNFNHILFCGDCGGRMKYCDKVDSRGKELRIVYFYICPNSESYGNRFCRKKRIKVQQLENTIEAALRLHIRLFLDAKSAMTELNKTKQAQQKKTDLKKQISDISKMLQKTQNMSSHLYSDYADGLLNERDYLFAKKQYLEEAERYEMQLSELSELQQTYQEGYAGEKDMAEVLEQYADFQELTSENVHALISRIVIYDAEHIEICYNFADQLKGFVEMVERRREELA